MMICSTASIRVTPRAPNKVHTANNDGLKCAHNHPLHAYRPMAYCSGARVTSTIVVYNAILQLFFIGKLQAEHLSYRVKVLLKNA